MKDCKGAHDVPRFQWDSFNDLQGMGYAACPGHADAEHVGKADNSRHYPEHESGHKADP